MRARLGDQTELFFLVGADSWLEITTWHEWRRLLALCHLIVVARPGFDLKAFDREKVAPPGRVIDSTGRGCRQLINMSTMGGEPSVMLTDAVMLDISATTIRATARTRDFDKLKELVPPQVAAYIEKHRLYID
jgi:nicotinate-nucleotide adenylyltransferase